MRSLKLKTTLKEWMSKNFPKIQKTRFAAIKQLEIIGEAANHIGNYIKKSSPHISWDQIIALRHILVHDYYQVDNAILWRIIAIHLPEFKMQINELIEGD